ncbi:unnamed protein product, partial [Protopolystoma xenopodis]
MLGYERRKQTEMLLGAQYVDAAYASQAPPYPESINYDVLKTFIESSPVPEILDVWLDNIMEKIPKKLKCGKETGLNKVLEEVRQNFLQ